MNLETLSKMMDFLKIKKKKKRKMQSGFETNIYKRRNRNDFFQLVGPV